MCSVREGFPSASVGTTARPSLATTLWITSFTTHTTSPSRASKVSLEHHINSVSCHTHTSSSILERRACLATLSCSVALILICAMPAVRQSSQILSHHSLSSLSMCSELLVVRSAVALVKKASLMLLNFMLISQAITSMCWQITCEDVLFVGNGQSIDSKLCTRQTR